MSVFRVPFVVLLVGAAILGGCVKPAAVEPAPPPGTIATGSRVNLVQIARLALAEEVEVRKFSTEAATAGDRNPYVSKASIRDRGTLDELVRALDAEVEVGMSPACIPNYEVVFHRSDGVVVTFGYLCSEGKQDSWIIPHRTSVSDGSFRLGGEVKVSPRFRELLLAELAKAPASTALSPSTSPTASGERPMPTVTPLPAPQPTATRSTSAFQPWRIVRDEVIASPYGWYPIGNYADRLPRFSPDGKLLAYLPAEGGNPLANRLVVRDLATGAERDLTPEPSHSYTRDRKSVV